MADADKYLTTVQVAEFFPILKSSLLERLRAKGEGPPYLKFGAKNARVFYRKSSVEKWIKEKEIRNDA